MDDPLLLDFTCECGHTPGAHVALVLSTACYWCDCPAYRARKPQNDEPAAPME